MGSFKLTLQLIICANARTVNVPAATWAQGLLNASVGRAVGVTVSRIWYDVLRMRIRVYNPSSSSIIYDQTMRAEYKRGAVMPEVLGHAHKYDV